MPKKIIITGGHITPAIAVMEELKRRGGWEIYLIGRNRSLEGDQGLSGEEKIASSFNIPFYPITTGRLQRMITFHSLSSLLKFPIGIYQSMIILRQINPDIILSFGGYVALSVATAGWMLRIPVVTHEQTTVLGLTNRLISRFARRVYLSWDNTKYAEKLVNLKLTGNPLRRELFDFSSSSLPKKIRNDKPLLYITGGSLGSRSINSLILPIIPILLDKSNVVHQVGSADNCRDYERLTKIRNRLRIELQRRYFLFPRIEAPDVGWLMTSADLIIGRSGANTVAEILAFENRALLIPLPWAADQEQYLNAEILAKKGKARILSQDKIYSQLLLDNITDILKTKASKNKSRISINTSAKMIAVDLEKIVQQSNANT